LIRCSEALTCDGVLQAQDLGLHRAESVKQNIELRRRLWGICVISDRWYVFDSLGGRDVADGAAASFRISLAYGHPFMIDVQDCDVRLPSGGDPNDSYLDELVRLSVLLGRVLKTIYRHVLFGFFCNMSAHILYSPSGLTLTTDDILQALLNDIESWKAKLPESLKFRGPDTSRNAGMSSMQALGHTRAYLPGTGLLHLLYSCVNMIFWRVFMRISYSCPAHLKFTLSIENWNSLVELTGDSVDWLDRHEHLYDVWLLVAYATTSCALVQVSRTSATP
jgi:hypothetical protein